MIGWEKIMLSGFFCGVDVNVFKMAEDLKRKIETSKLQREIDGTTDDFSRQISVRLDVLLHRKSDREKENQNERNQ
jgi:predicted nucleotide-binding protein (sugar kinase/HSP70/actin superfamily)